MHAAHAKLLHLFTCYWVNESDQRTFSSQWRATDRKVMPMQFFFLFWCFHISTVCIPWVEVSQEKPSTALLSYNKKKLTLTSTCSCLLSVVRRMRKFFIHFSMFSSKCSGKSCNIYFHNQLKILLEWALKVQVNKFALSLLYRKN